MHSTMLKRVSSFSSLIVIINNTEIADAEMLQLQIYCWQAYFEPFCGANRNGIVRSQNLLAPLQREKNSLIFKR